MHNNHHFARVTPIVGTSLGHTRVAVIGFPAADPIVYYLAACGVAHWAGLPVTLTEQLRAHHGTALPLTVCDGDAIDLVIAVGQPHWHAAITLARLRRCALLLVEPSPGSGQACRVWVGGFVETRNFVFLRTPMPAARTGEGGSACWSVEPEPWPWCTSAPLVAGLARALLLRGTAFARADLEALWQAGRVAVTIGGAHPFDITFAPAWNDPHTTPAFISPVRPVRLLAAGLGSLGSVATMLLAPQISRAVLIDPGHVSSANIVRQAYGVAKVGQPKATALAAQISGAATLALTDALTDEQTVMALARTVDVALVATGSDADFAIARGLRAAGVPHIVARCYPRARYYELVLVDGHTGPAFAEVRGHIRYGPTPTPTPEQLAAYSPHGALEAEPATLIESGWAAAWLARCAAQLALPAGLRERWMTELLAHGQTCLVGGVAVEITADGPAYGVALPGQIHGWAVTR